MTFTNSSAIEFVNGCPLPFLSASKYPTTGGYLAGRHCVPLPGGSSECCLPCPLQQWAYPNDFQSWLDAASYLNLVSCACCVLLLLSFLVLPVSATHRHYLSVSLVFAVLLMELGFVVPFRQGHHQCYNDITPNDMKTSNICALSGAFLLGGGWCVVMWVFLRALSLHLQICWQVIPGKHFFIGSQVVGWSVPAGMLAVALSVTGVSYRFGDTCHINSHSSLGSFWGPLLAFAAAAIVIQFVTFSYCLQVYLRSLFEDKASTDNASSIPYTNSLVSVSYGQALRRIRRVVSLQWRGIMVVIIIIADVVFFATVFLQFDFTTSNTPENIKAAMPWAICLVENRGDANVCRPLASHLTVGEGTAIATIFLLSCNGFWVLVLLGQTSIIAGWVKFFKTKFRRNRDKDDFVSYHAVRGPGPSPISAVRMYEELHSKTDSPDYQKTDLCRVPTREINTKGSRSGDHSSFQSYEMSRSPQSHASIINRESIRPASRKRASSERNFSVNFSLPPKSPRISEDPEMGYGIAVTMPPEEPLPERPRFQRSVTSPTPTMHSHTRSLSIGRTRAGNISPEQEALELSLASSLPRGRPYNYYNNGGVKYPPAVTRV